MSTSEISADAILRDLLEASPIGVAVLDPETGERLFVNSALARMFGAASLDDLIGHDIGNSWVDKHELEKAMAVFRNKEVLNNFEAERTRIDGSRWWVLMNTQPVIFEGQDAGIIWHVDISERKLVEEELRSRQEIINEAVKIANLGHWTWDLLLDKCTYCSEEYARIYGYSTEEYLNRLSSGDLDYLNAHPDDKDLHLEIVLEANHNGTAWDHTYRIISRNGETRYVREIGNPVVDDNGHLIQSIGTIQDITERKQAETDAENARLAAATAEARLRDILEALPIGVLEFDSDKQIRFWNQAFLDITGLSIEVLNDNSDYLELAHYIYDNFVGYQEDTFDVFCENWVKNALPDQRRMTDQIFTEPYYDLQHYAAPLPTGGYVNAYVDVTPQKTAEREALEARDQAQAAAIAKSSFLATMSHEIRTPMNGVIGMLDLLTRSKLDRSQREMAETVRTSAFSLLRIIDDILDFSKIEAGQLKFERYPFSLCQAVEAVGETLVPGAREKGLAISLFIDPAIPEPLLGDPVRLRQVLFNLIGNAIKFTKSGFVTVRAELQKQPEGSSTSRRQNINFSVEDSGIGIPQHAQEGLFDAFVQAESSTNRRFGGTGLGLSICAHLIELQGGKIDVISQPGKGSNFIFNLAYDLAADEKPLRDIADNDLADLNVLLVMWLETNNVNLSHYLQHWKADVDTICDIGKATETALAKAKSGRKYDIVVLGAHWSMTYQYEICDQIRAMPELAGTRFVLFTFDRMWSGDTGMDDTVVVSVAPLHRADFLTAVAVAAGRISPEVRHIEELEYHDEIEPLSIEDAEQTGSLVLVAEDNLVNQRVILRQLNRLGYTAIMAEDGREAMEKFSLHKYGLLLTDCHMPEMDGFELCAAIRATEKGQDVRLPIVAITANALQGEAERCLAAGMDDFVAKPVELKQLQAVVQKWLPDAVPTVSLPVEGDTYSGALEAANSTPINFARLREISGEDDTEFLIETLEFFREMIADTPDRLAQLIRNKDAKALCEAAHETKGAALYAAAIDLSDLMKNLEFAARANDWQEIAKLEDLIKPSFTEVTTYILSLSSGERSISP
ncbi:MAG: PAS domain S-box protein [Alphaproteobacteria bacterium]|nr:PAS domain S-box protein [Alphaproteobacteria bacterium]MBT4019022.1 PAS domain S-box protein [Alphaproteobacteria bacterium]MBT4965647.1 PAS domain S-box protein [Alphaproteobacteria bacterium]MBT5159516.1 PAS domain S-box protein [Alphaproteobacteria bacterium]MBT5917374.1 PAS domain S-box protein [Alphaproteobacteria bacterium]